MAKAYLDVPTVPTDAAFRLAHDAAGLATLRERLGAVGPTLIVLEATGGHEVAVWPRWPARGCPSSW